MSRGLVSRFLKSFWQLVVGALCMAGGAAAIFLGWYGSAHTRDVTDQIPYVISGGLLGAALIIAGGSFYFSFYVSRLQAATRRQAAALERTAARLEALASLARAPAHPNGDVFAVPGGRRFHRAECSLVAGKPAKAITAAEASRRRLEPCRTCEPMTAT